MESVSKFWSRRLAVGAATAALVLPLTVGQVVAPAAQASTVCSTASVTSPSGDDSVYAQTVTVNGASVCDLRFAFDGDQSLLTDDSSVYSWTVPTGVTSMDVIVVGGGAGGGGGAPSVNAGGGGGAGGDDTATLTVLENKPIDVIVGAGGPGGAATGADGVDGRLSSFTYDGTLTLTAQGGSKGLGGRLSPPSGGASGNGVAAPAAGQTAPLAGGAGAGSFAAGGAVGAPTTANQYKGGTGGEGRSKFSFGWMPPLFGPFLLDFYFGGGGGGGSSSTAMIGGGGAAYGNFGGEITATGTAGSGVSASYDPQGTGLWVQAGSGGGGGASTGNNTGTPPSGGGGAGAAGLVLVRFVIPSNPTPTPNPPAPPPPPTPEISPTSQALRAVLGAAVAPTSAFTLQYFTQDVVYSIAPPLPAGLEINRLTGIVSGTPTAVYPPTNHVITASAGGGYQTATSLLQVSVAAVPVPPPAPDPVPVPQLKPGGSYLTVDGVPQEVKVTANAQSDGVNIVGDDFSMNLQGLDGQGQPLRLARDGVLILNQDRQVQTTGTGFMATSEVDLYLDPPTLVTRSARSDKGTYIGTVTTNSSGAFAGTATLPPGISVGDHVVQAVGLSKAGAVRAMSIGVRVEPSATLVLNQGTRKPDGRHDRIRTTGSSTGIPAGTKLTPYIKYSGQSSFSGGKATIVVQADGSFTWTRQIRKDKAVTGYVTWTDVESNKVTWAKVR